jgi:hypothetical protein
MLVIGMVLRTARSGSVVDDVATGVVAGTGVTG